MRNPDSVKMAIGCAVLLFTLALIIGLVRAALKLRHPDVNRKAVLSYIFFVTGWLLYAAIAAIGVQTGGGFGITLIALLVFAGFGFAGVVLAILGLSDRTYEEGRGTAVTTLVLSSLVIVGIVSLFGLGVLAGLQGPPGIAPPGAIATFDDLKFSIQPPHPWTRIEASKVNPNATVVFRHSRPEAYVMVIAEKVDEDEVFDLESMADGVKEHLEEVTDSVKVINEADETVNGLPGRRLLCELDLKGSRQAYLCWLHVAEDRVYQLIAWGDQKDASAVLSLSRRAFDSFTLLQPK